MNGKVVVITGATSGIGQVAAETLARRGAKIVLIARDRDRAEATKRRLSECGGAKHTVHLADLSRLSEMKRVAQEVCAAESRVDVLINNAGAMFGERRVTEDGLEMTFALNHVSYFVLAHGLLPRLAASAPARIVNTASRAHRIAPLDFEDLQSERAYSQTGLLEWLRYGGPGFKVYGRSKLCNILFTDELSRRIAGAGVTANSLHPGFVATRFGDESGGLLSFGTRVAKRFALSLDEGAKTLVYLASAPEVATITGRYFHNCAPATPTRDAQDRESAQRLWRITEEIAQMRWT